MASYKPHHVLEARFYELESIMYALGAFIDDGLPSTSALKGLHERLSNIHAEFKADLLF